MPVRTYTTDSGTSYTKVTGSVFESATGTPDEVASLRVRAFLLRALRHHLRASGETQAVLAERLGTTQPRVSALLKGRLSQFSLATLVDYTVRSGLQVHVDVTAHEAGCGLGVLPDDALIVADAPAEVAVIHGDPGDLTDDTAWWRSALHTVPEPAASEVSANDHSYLLAA